MMPRWRTWLIGMLSLAVIIAADAWGIERQAVADALATFRNVRRRAEVRRAHPRAAARSPHRSGKPDRARASQVPSR